MSALRITGTFLDEITHDIPSQNWGAEEWNREFEIYRRIGIDTLVVIRAGYRDRCVFAAESLPDLRPAREDLLALFLDLAGQYGLRLFVGLYDSGHHWLRGAWWREVEVNVAFVAELARRYGGHEAFAGWYLPHETSRNDLNIIEVMGALGKACKEALPLPVLISPFPQGVKQFGGDAFTLDETMDHWQRIFAGAAGAFDVCAFQDGQIEYTELPAFYRAVRTLCDSYGVRMWANVESFDRDMPIRFPPADWRNLAYKLDAAAPHVEKAITFEFPHFMSPQSCWPSARNLFRRYCEAVGIDAT